MPHTREARRAYELRRRSRPVGWDPACMEPDELAGWQALNAQVAASVRAARPCEDCLPDFAAEMRALGCCNGAPGGGASPPAESGTISLRLGRLPVATR